VAGKTFPVIVEIGGKIAASLGGAIGSAEARLKKMQAIQNSSLVRGAKSLLPVSLAAGVGLGVMVKQAFDFDASLNSIKRTANLTNTQMAGMSKEALKLAPTLGILPKEYLEIAGAMAALGTKKEDLAAVTSQVARLGMATDTPVEKMADMGRQLTAVNSIFKQNIAQSEIFAGALNYVDDNIGGTASGILDFTARVGSMAATVKMSSQDTAVFGGVMAKLGLPADRASTSFNAMVGSLANISTAAPKAQKGFAALGVDAGKVTSLMNSGKSTQAIQYFLSTLNKSKLPLTEVVGAMNKAFGRESADEILALSKGLKDVDRGLKGVADTSKLASSMSEANANSLATVGGQSKKMMATLQAIAVQFGSILLPPINAVLSAVTPLLQKFSEFASVNPWVGAIAVGLLAIVAIVPPLIAGVGAVAAGFAAIGGGAVLAPILAIGAGLGILAAIIPSVWSGLQKMGAVFISSLSPEAAAMINAGLAMIGGGLRNIGSVIMGVIPMILQIGSGFLQGATIAIQGVAMIANALAALPAKTNEIINTVKSAFQGLPAFLGSIGTAMMDALASGITSRASAVIGSVNSTLAGIKAMLPQSDPKEGALKNLTQLGRNIPLTLGLGVTQGSAGLTSPVSAMMGDSSTAIASASPSGGNVGGASVIIHAPVTINGAGGDTGSLQAQIQAAFQEIQQQFELAQRSSLA